MVKRKCFKSGCREYIDYNKKYCERHKGLDNKTYNKQVRFNETNRKYYDFYNSSQWRKLSKRKRYANPLCEHCLAQGRIKQAGMVDHVVEIREEFDLRFEWDNLQSLCNNCHNTKTKTK